ncbi:MAG: tetratricopeptide repeat protein [Polyangiaceae bacterium]|nr:tetratricopeptide repeat protein [Myxococcales bacterium]MCB9584314.1 tetratricopeptide repeat protein [Polyangiaceae bacterium]
MDESGRELEELRREVVESRSLTIKTNNLVNALAADLKSMAKRQQQRERGVWLNNATIYVVSVAVLLVVLKIAWDARVEAVTSSANTRLARLEGVEAELEALKSKSTGRGESSKTAGELYELVRANKQKELLEKWPDAQKANLSKTERSIFEDAVSKARSDLSLVAYQEGLDHVRTGRWHEARTALEESLRLDSGAAHSPQAQYNLALALKNLGDQRKAIPILMKLSEASSDREVMDDALWLLAQSQIDIKAWNDAKSTLRSFIRRFPKSPYINDVRMKAAEINLQH